MECPTGRGATGERPLVWLPSSQTRDDAYQGYINRFRTLMDHLSAQRVLEEKEGIHSTEPLTKPSILRF